MAKGGSKPQYDYNAMRLEFVEHGTSFRQLAEKYGVKSASTVSQYAGRHGWQDQRDRYLQIQEQRSVEVLAEKRAQKIEAIDSAFLDTLHASLLSLGINLEDRWVKNPDTGETIFVRGRPVDAQGITKLMDKYLILSGNVTSREAHVGINLNVNPEDIPRDVLRELRDLAEEQGAGEGSVGQSPLPSISGARKVS